MSNMKELVASAAQSVVATYPRHRGGCGRYFVKFDESSRHHRAPGARADEARAKRKQRHVSLWSL